MACGGWRSDVDCHPHCRRSGWTAVSVAAVALWLAVVAAVGTARAASERQSSEGLVVLSLVSEDDDSLARFRRSLERQRLEFLPVYANDAGAERTAKSAAVSWRRRLDLIRTALLRLEEAGRASTRILVVDGYNTIINGGENVVLDAYAASNCDVLLAADDTCSSEDIPFPAADASNESRCAKPSAGFIGEARRVRQLLERVHSSLASQRARSVGATSANGGEDLNSYDRGDFAEERTLFARVLRVDLSSANEDSSVPLPDFGWLQLTTSTCSAASSNATTSKRITEGHTAVCTSQPKEKSSPLNVKLDLTNALFQPLEGAAAMLEVQFAGTQGYVYNKKSGTAPCVISGSGAAKVNLNSLGNYLAGEWSPSDGCVACHENRFSLNDKDGDRSHYPTIFIALFAEKPTPFLSSFYERVEKFEHPPEKIDLLVFNQEPYNEAAASAFVHRAVGKYHSVKYIKDQIGIRAARNAAVSECLSIDCNYMLLLDSDAHLTMPRALSLLIGQNRSVVVPLLTRPGRLWSNFWGALSSDGYYARSDDYLDIVTFRKIGLWNMPFVASAILVNASALRRLPKNPFNYGNNTDDDKMSFCANARDSGVFMYVDNQHSYGHMVNADDFDSKRASPELYELFSNSAEWRKKYLHPNYSHVVDSMQHVSEPCPDVYWFPMMSEAFCDELVTLMESHGQWSSGGNEDARLQGGYEAVPTRDIHMKQVDFELHWLAILQHYVQPIQRLLFTGYQSQNKALLNFVVRYRPDEQPSLRPHHDTSTFTINMALNTRGVDYEGGGVRFIRYNCSVLDLKKGWMLMHPGRLTHYHEGLATTNGTRYIMVSFVDP